MIPASLTPYPPPLPPPQGVIRPSTAVRVVLIQQEARRLHGCDNVEGGLRIIHLALGGCLRAPPVAYGLTADTGGHIAYVLEAACAQALHLDVEHVTIVTRLFDEEALGAAHAEPFEALGPKISIVRIAGARRAYLEKGELDAELPALSRSFLDYVSYHRPDVVHAHFADAVEVASPAVKRLRIPLVYTPHSLGLDRYGSSGLNDPLAAARFARERRAIACADRIIVSTTDEAFCQVGAYSVSGAASRVHCVPPGIPNTEVIADCIGAMRILVDYLEDPGRPIVLAVARPVRRKNLSTVIDAFAGHERLRSAANLIVLAGLLGGDPEGQAIRQELETSVVRAGLMGRVALPPQHTTAELKGLYALAAASGGVFVNAALHEPFGLTLLEAACAGLPVVATRRGGAADVVRSLGHGLLIDPNNSVEIAACCWRIVSEPTFAARLQSSGRRRINAFNWNEYARDSCAIYRAAALRDVLQTLSSKTL
jgi:sucrose-phosphate synthase